MPVWLTFFLSLVAVGGLFFGLFMAIQVTVGRRQSKGRPRLKLSSGEQSGQLGIAVDWNTNFYTVEFYRISISMFSPEHDEKESRFTVSYLPTQSAPFFQSVSFPANFKSVIEGTSDKRAIFNISVRTTDEMSLEKDLSLPAMRKLYHGSLAKAPAKLNKLELAVHDPVANISLDFEELSARTARVSNLISAAKAKAEKAAAAAAAKKAADEAKAAPADKKEAAVDANKS